MIEFYVIFGAAVRPDGSPSGTLRRRVEGAFILGGARASTRYLPTGGQGKFGPTEAAIMKDLLLERGVSAAQIILEDQATDTLDSVINCRDIIMKTDANAPVYTCTSPYHMFRCRTLLRLAGLDARVTRMPGDLSHLGFTKFIYYWLREVPATVWDVFLILTFRR